MGYVAIAITECFLTQISYIFTTRPRNKQKKKEEEKERNATKQTQRQCRLVRKLEQKPLSRKH